MTPGDEVTGVSKWKRDYLRQKERMARDPEFRRLQSRRRNHRRRRQFANDPKAKADFVQRKRHRLWSKKRLVIAEAKGTTCGKCGGTYPKAELDFHHRDPLTKLFDLSSGHRHSYAAIEKEIAKSIVLCRVCHCELHHPPTSSSPAAWCQKAAKSSAGLVYSPTLRSPVPAAPTKL
jgi:hypothetical protein